MDNRLVGQALFVARITERVRQRVAQQAQQNATRLLGARHSGYVFHQPGERRDLLIEMIRGSLARKRVTVVLHSMATNAAMLRFLHGKRLPQEEVAGNKALILVPAQQVWPSRRPDPTATLELVEQLQALGNTLGHREIQLISDANHSFVRDRSCDAVLALEEWWNRAHVEGVRLACLYRPGDVPDPQLENIVRMHQT